MADITIETDITIKKMRARGARTGHRHARVAAGPGGGGGGGGGGALEVSEDASGSGNEGCVVNSGGGNSDGRG